MKIIVVTCSVFLASLMLTQGGENNSFLNSLIHQRYTTILVSLKKKSKKSDTNEILDEHKQLVVLGFGYWYGVTYKKIDKDLSFEVLLSKARVRFFHDKSIHKILYVTRNPSNEKMSKNELLAWYQLSSFPCDKFDFMDAENFKKKALLYEIWLNER